MSRVINPNSAGKQRTKLIRMIALAVRELLRQPEPNAETRDLAIFIALSLDAIAETITPSVEAWEKRGYWIKADRFRMEWRWAKQDADEMREALFVEDWGAVALTAVKIAQQPQIAAVKISPRHRMGRPWEGAWNRYRSSNA